MSLYDSMASSLEKVKEAGRMRTISSKNQIGNKIVVDGREYVNLSSNDYLGLGSNLELASEFLDSLSGTALRMSSSGSPLLTGAHESYEKALTVMEKLFNKKALFFNSGFAANSGVLSALSKPDVLIIADKLAHASMIDGMTLAQGKCIRFAHNDCEHLKSLISSKENSYDAIIVVTEAVFSMDGDRSLLKELVQIKKEHPKVHLYVDEAHSFAVFNQNGAGLCAQAGVSDEIDFILTTFGKGLGSQGACLLCNEVSRQYLINYCRSLIFSTALSPLSFAHAAFMAEYMQKHNELRERLNSISSYIHNAIYEKTSFANVSQSQIVPLIVQENDAAVRSSEILKEQGFYAMPIRHPTVPLGQARLRISLCASLSDSDVERLALAFAKIDELFGIRQ